MAGHAHFYMPRPLINRDPFFIQAKFEVEGGEMVVTGGEMVVTGRELDLMVVTGEEMYSGAVVAPRDGAGGGWWIVS